MCKYHGDSMDVNYGDGCETWKRHNGYDIMVIEIDVSNILCTLINGVWRWCLHTSPRGWKINVI